MRTPYRRSSIVRAVDLRDRRQRLGLTADRMTVELPGLGRAAVIPIREADAQARPVRREPLRPGEAAWIALTENQEAIDSLESLQAAVTLHDRPALVALYEQIVCDPRHAAELVAEAIDRLDPTVGPEAAINHATKLMRRGVLAANSPPLDAA